MFPLISDDSKSFPLVVCSLNTCLSSVYVSLPHGLSKPFFLRERTSMWWQLFMGLWPPVTNTFFIYGSEAIVLNKNVSGGHYPSLIIRYLNMLMSSS